MENPAALSYIRTGYYLGTRQRAAGRCRRSVPEMLGEAADTARGLLPTSQDSASEGVAHLPIVRCPHGNKTRVTALENLFENVTEAHLVLFL